MVGYPIIDLGAHVRDVGKYIASLESIMIYLCRTLCLNVGRVKGYPGVWIHPEKTSAKKLGFVGVRISRWITMHGFALNYLNDPKDFDMIVPCGIPDKKVTSICNEIAGKSNLPSMRSLQKASASHFAAIYNYEIRWHFSPPIF